MYVSFHQVLLYTSASSHTSLVSNIVYVFSLPYPPKSPCSPRTLNLRYPSSYLRPPPTPPKSPCCISSYHHASRRLPAVIHILYKVFPFLSQLQLSSWCSWCECVLAVFLLDKSISKIHPLPAF